MGAGPSRDRLRQSIVKLIETDVPDAVEDPEVSGPVCFSSFPQRGCEVDCCVVHAQMCLQAANFWDDLWKISTTPEEVGTGWRRRADRPCPS